MESAASGGAIDDVEPVVDADVQIGDAVLFDDLFKNARHDGQRMRGLNVRSQNVEQAVLLEHASGDLVELDGSRGAGDLVADEQAWLSARPGDLGRDERPGTASEHQQRGFDAHRGPSSQKTASGLTGLPVTPWNRMGASAN